MKKFFSKDEAGRALLEYVVSAFLIALGIVIAMYAFGGGNIHPPFTKADISVGPHLQEGT